MEINSEGTRYPIMSSPIFSGVGRCGCTNLLFSWSRMGQYCEHGQLQPAPQQQQVVCIADRIITFILGSSWNVMAHGDARERKWRGNWRIEWVASTLHTTSEHGVSSITTADAHTSAASSLLNWRPRRFKGTRPFRRKTKSGLCACAIMFQMASANRSLLCGWTDELQSTPKTLSVMCV